MKNNYACLSVYSRITKNLPDEIESGFHRCIAAQLGNAPCPSLISNVIARNKYLMYVEDR